MDQQNNWKTKTLIAGTLIGLFTGLAASYIMINQAEKLQQKPTISPTDGVKLGLGVFTFLRLVADVTKRD